MLCNRNILLYAILSTPLLLLTWRIQVQERALSAVPDLCETVDYAEVQGVLFPRVCVRVHTFFTTLSVLRSLPLGCVQDDSNPFGKSCNVGNFSGDG